MPFASAAFALFAAWRKSSSNSTNSFASYCSTKELNFDSCFVIKVMPSEITRRKKFDYSSPFDQAFLMRYAKRLKLGASSSAIQALRSSAKQSIALPKRSPLRAVLMNRSIIFCI